MISLNQLWMGVHSGLHALLQLYAVNSLESISAWCLPKCVKIGMNPLRPSCVAPQSQMQMKRDSKRMRWSLIHWPTRHSSFGWTLRGATERYLRSCLGLCPLIWSGIGKLMTCVWGFFRDTNTELWFTSIGLRAEGEDRTCRARHSPPPYQGASLPYQRRPRWMPSCMPHDITHFLYYILTGSLL